MAVGDMDGGFRNAIAMKGCKETYENPKITVS